MFYDFFSENLKKKYFLSDKKSEMYRVL